MGNGYPHSTIAQILEDIIDQLSFEGESHSNIADILLSILNQTSYDKEPYSVLAELFLKLKAKIEGEPFDPYNKETHSVIAEILLSILNETEYADIPQSRIAELLLELKEELESYTEITVSGSIVSFTTNVSKPLVKLKANVEAQQDLHGYDKPWAGGGGSNKWDEEWESGIISNTGENVTSITPRIRSKNYISCSPNTSYYFYFGSTNYSIRLCFYDSNKSFISVVNDSWNTVYTTPATCYYMRFCVSGADISTYNNNISINYPSTVTTYSPYANICPITGWSGANVTRTGKNLFVNTNPILGRYLNDSGSQILGSGWNISDYIPIKGGQTYHFKPNSTLGGSAYGYFYTADSVASTIAESRFRSGEITITAPSEARYVRFSYRDSSSDIQLELGSTATAYAPYNGNTYTIQFGDTYYGCEVDVTNGVLRVEKAYVPDMSTLDWVGVTSEGVVRTSGMTEMKYHGDLICSQYKGIKTDTLNDLEISVTNSQALPLLRLKNTAFIGMTVPQVKTQLSGVQLVYQLATPIEIQLTPQQIEQLEENNIWADTGDVEVTYLYKGTPET